MTGLRALHVVSHLHYRLVPPRSTGEQSPILQYSCYYLVVGVCLMDGCGLHLQPATWAIKDVVHAMQLRLNHCLWSTARCSHSHSHVDHHVTSTSACASKSRRYKRASVYRQASHSYQAPSFVLIRQWNPLPRLTSSSYQACLIFWQAAYLRTVVALSPVAMLLP